MGTMASGIWAILLGLAVWVLVAPTFSRLASLADVVASLVK